MPEIWKTEEFSPACAGPDFNDCKFRDAVGRSQRMKKYVIYKKVNI